MLLTDPDVPVSRLRTVDNAANLSASFLAEVVGKSAGTRLERQELEGDLLEDTDGALWTPDIIDAHRVDPTAVPDLTPVVVAIDPAAKSARSSDETGIIVAGEDGSGHAWVLADYSMRGSPDTCMKRAVRGGGTGGVGSGSTSGGMCGGLRMARIGNYTESLCRPRRRTNSCSMLAAWLNRLVPVFA